MGDGDELIRGLHLPADDPYPDEEQEPPVNPEGCGWCGASGALSLVVLPPPSPTATWTAVKNWFLCDACHSLARQGDVERLLGRRPDDPDDPYEDEDHGIAQLLVGSVR